MSPFQLRGDTRRTQDLYALMKRRGFFWPSYEIYGGVAGFFDLGPLGSLLRENIERAWKDRFIVQEDFLLVDCPSITPEIAFRSSGHLDKFSDKLTRCRMCSAPFRADHLLEGIIENAESLTTEDLDNAILENGLGCPVCGGDLGNIEEFNLMFKTYIGPGGEKPAYLRPETAQSIFMDFSLLYRMNRERMPFGVAQLGKGFRNEISPRQGMIRQREFHMAEGEFFFDPEMTNFPPFKHYRGVDVKLIPNTDPGTTIDITLGEAVESGMICSEVLAHFMGVTASFADEIGIHVEHMRFRQHLEKEMAHYARDCWDMEVETSYGWVEMVGIADRSAFDLKQHAKGSGQDLVAKRKFPEPETRTIEKIEVKLKVLGPIFRGKAKEVAEAVERLDVLSVRKMIENGGPVELLLENDEIKVPSEAVTVKTTIEKVSFENFTPHVVEPSFGIDRLMIAAIEHAYHESDKSPMKEQIDDDDDNEGPYRVLRLVPRIAPIKCGVFPLMNKDGLPEIARRIEQDLKKIGVTTNFDHSGSIGRRYARMDEIGTPFSITVDYDSKNDGAATIRFRDTGKQERVLIKEIPSKINEFLL